MGGCLTLDREEALARRRSNEIDKQLLELARQEGNVIKILLLGAGESGKSTLVKQMKIIHSDGFTKDELLSFAPTIRDNLLSSMKYVLAGMGCVDKMLAMIPAVISSLHALWQDRGVRLAVARGYEYELNDSAIYMFENMERICGEKYVPTPTDVLRARRSQRRKWIYCFDDVKAVLFVVSLSGYDMSLVEDPSVNRLEESLTLFSQIVNNRFFRDATFLLFLNKLDLFREKILYSGRHLRLYFPEYKGPDCDVDRAALFTQHKFATQNTNPSRSVSTHFTTATDTANVQAVVQVVFDSVLCQNMRQVTLL
ncbi:hypothetical protein B566_EDAN017179 [Ephemera danica]|nr:hypothetical protein B566_EDAN017179 [Ephemera danica]